jgi:transcriptional regulator GlxA family with amidase domain
MNERSGLYRLRFRCVKLHNERAFMTDTLRSDSVSLPPTATSDHALGMRERILAGAKRAFLVSGFRGTSVPAIAAEAGVHLRHLERLFHRHLGVSPRGYYQRLRLAQARDLVQGTMLGLARVAEAVGFDSLSHFSKCYMDAHGVRPSEDRQRHFTTPGDQPGDGLMGDVSKLKQQASKRPAGARRHAA